MPTGYALCQEILMGKNSNAKLEDTTPLSP